MNLDENQRKQVAQWIAEGCKLAEIQKRLGSELGIRLTYMETRLLVDDLKLTPKDAEKAPASLLDRSAPSAAKGQPKPGAPVPGKGGTPTPPEPEPTAAKGRVTVAADHLAKPGAVVSGKVTFSDGKTAEWYLDQTGRLGLVPPQAGYRPSEADLQEFQVALDAELSRLGL